MNRTFAIKGLALATLAMAMGATQPSCPTLPNPVKVIDGVCFRTYKPAGSSEDRAWGEVRIMWSAASLLQFGSGTIPILARDRLTGQIEQFGQVITSYNRYRNPPGSDMLVQFDIDRMGQQYPQTGGDLMPNGQLQPLAVGGGESSGFKIPLNNPNETPKNYLYFAAAEHYLMLGTTVQVRSWDKFGAQVAGLPLMIPILDPQTGRTVFAGGLYTSATPGLNGVGAFFDLSDIYNIGANELCKNGNGQVVSPPPASN
jgi:hypothetical protein